MITKTARNVLAALTISLAVGSAARAADFTMPKTAADHEAMAKKYDQMAADYRKVAAEHRDMAAAARSQTEEFRGHPSAASKAAADMEKHCSKIMTDANKLASDAEYEAKFHRARAKELAGK
jgi:hypothetical protein